MVFREITDLDWPFNDDVEVVWGVSFAENDFTWGGLKVFEAVHDFLVGISSGLEEKLMVEKYGFYHVPVRLSEFIGPFFKEVDILFAFGSLDVRYSSKSAYFGSTC